MSDFPYSVSLAVPASRQANADLLAVALGWDVAPGRTFSVPLSATGAAPATHYGCHTWAGPVFIATLSGAQGSTLPDTTWADHGLTAGEVQDVVDAMLVNVTTGEVGFNAFLTANGLQMVSVGLA